MTLKAISLLLLFVGTVLALPALAGNGWAMGLSIVIFAVGSLLAALRRLRAAQTVREG